MEARPVKQQHRLNKHAFVLISMIIIVIFSSISIITESFNYAISSLITVVLINLTIILKTVRSQKKKPLNQD
ncbi:hypothetical protein SAMN05192559_105289 [Halobacillus karajensis]|uniref:Uncharacterized protein n=1 Tax=Halobacillus karajensis TaxID=195088 RepID=A0A024P6W6_9BACI|nr:hypothetical protein [Halobacillus karajensis]CDQ20449.1 hypothetical protein BN982_02790 [Halobacillus karajensis]CDQ24082.1 hypothetical protein BN983_02347 [Halobacillus karajensis]CDQ27560.1 hypothetical protein BN981_01828 [Halobacillus karajensis]SEH91508.1 hypothetical protein SAMN05192559_105289 [Halobacillus karajensis]